MAEKHIVVAGARGLVGRAAMEHFARRGHMTTATAQRRPFDTYGATFVPVDLADEAACRAAFSGLHDVTQIAFAALHEEPGLVEGWTTQAHVDRNERMPRDLVEAIAPNAPRLRNITILQGPRPMAATSGGSGRDRARIATRTAPSRTSTERRKTI